MSEIAMQSRCVECGLEQYGPAVWGISHGKQGCAWCGHNAGELTEERYRDLHQRRRELAAPPVADSSKDGQ